VVNALQNFFPWGVDVERPVGPNPVPHDGVAENVGVVDVPAAPCIVGGGGVWVEPAIVSLCVPAAVSNKETTGHVALEGCPGEAAALSETERVIDRRRGLRWRLSSAGPFAASSVPWPPARVKVRGWWWRWNRWDIRDVGVYPPGATRDNRFFGGMTPEEFAYARVLNEPANACPISPDAK
jgi:hypothetical protein